MVDDSERLAIARHIAQRLVSATGITEGQATELVTLLGWEWSSLLREARMIREPKRGPQSPI
jgi:hypothetical protein